MTSLGGSLTLFLHAPPITGGYAASKAAVNSLARRIHFEEEWLGTFFYSQTLHILAYLSEHCHSGIPAFAWNS
jgi:hypothetical protein